MGDNASLMLSALGGATKAYGTYEAGAANRDTNRANATLARMQESQVLQQAESYKQVEDLKQRRIAGTLAASSAGQGVLVGAGTSRAVLESSEQMSEMDKLMIDINASRRAWGYRTQATQYDLDAEQSMRRGRLGAVQTLMDTGTSIAEMDRKQRAARGDDIVTKQRDYDPTKDKAPRNTELDDIMFGGYMRLPVER